MRVMRFPAGFHPLDRTRINWITSVAFRCEPRLISLLDLEFLLRRSLLTEFDPLRKDCIGPVLGRCESRTVWSIPRAKMRCHVLPVNRNRRNKGV